MEDVRDHSLGLQRGHSASESILKDGRASFCFSTVGLLRATLHATTVWKSEAREPILGMILTSNSCHVATIVATNGDVKDVWR
jgi:hypothetical protein